MKFFFSKSVTAATNTSSAQAATLRCRVHSLSETGPTRNHNEDSILTYFFNESATDLLCMVADGMGGHNAGEVASKLTCDTVLAEVKKQQSTHQETILADALLKAHQEIIKAGKENSAYKGMGTTGTVVRIKNNQLFLGHVGDSRLYHWSPSGIEQLTQDHTLVNQMYQQGEITLQERDTHSMKNVLIQAIGTAQQIVPQQLRFANTLTKEDKFLLCSDGLYDVFSETQLQDLLSMKDPELILEAFKTIGYNRKAQDNFSAILITFTDEQLEMTPITKEQNIML